MKKNLILTLGLIGLTLATVSCGDDNDNHMDYTRERTWNVELLNHVCNTADSATTTAATASINTQKVVYRFTSDMANLTFNPTLVATVGGTERQYSLTGVAGANSEDHPNVYSFADKGVGDMSNFSGKIDFMDQNIYWNYLAEGKYKVISTLPTISTSSNTVTKSVWTDTTSTHTTPMTSFAIDPASMKATFTLNMYTNVKIPRTYQSITAKNADVAITNNGYHITGNGFNATATYMTSASSKLQTTTLEINNLDAIIDVENNAIYVTFNMAGARVTVNGTIYI